MPLGKSPRCCRRQIVVRDREVALQTCWIVIRLFMGLFSLKVVNLLVEPGVDESDSLLRSLVRLIPG